MSAMTLGSKQRFSAIAANATRKSMEVICPRQTTRTHC
jgi:hypothetical protein